MRIAIATALLLLTPGAALAAPDRQAVVSAAAATYSWDAPAASGANDTYEPASCTREPPTYCDQTLIKLDAAPGATGELKVTLGSYSGPQCAPLDSPRGPCDFSLRLYHSDANGKAGKQIATSGNNSGYDEAVTYKRAEQGHYLVVVFYYSVVQASYKGTITLTNLSAPPAPPVASVPGVPRLTARLAVLGRPSARRGIRTRITCSVSCQGTLIAELSAAQARRLRLGGRKLVVARTVVGAGPSATVTLRLSRLVAARVRRVRAVKLVLRAVLEDDAGSQQVRPLRAVTLAR